MRLTKKLLSVLLVLVLALTLAMPAFAENGEPPEEPNPAMPVITVQPVGGRIRVENRNDMLRVQAYIPNGDEIGFQWYRYSESSARRPMGRTAEITVIHPGDVYYYVVVYNRADPSLRVRSETVHVEGYRTFFNWVWFIVRTIPALLVGAFIFPPFPGFLIFMAPFIIPFVLYNLIADLFR